MIKILHLYYDYMNMYGEYTNVKAITKYLNKLEIPFFVDYKSVGDDIKISGYDFIYCGAGSERSFEYVLKDLVKYKQSLVEYVLSGKTLLFTGNACDLLSNSIDDDEAIGIFDYKAKRISDQRISGDVILESKFQEIVGHINQSINFEDGLYSISKANYFVNIKSDGFQNNNAYGFHLIGPLLTKNPILLKMFIQLIIFNKHYKYKDLDYSQEEKCHQSFIDYYNMHNKVK